MVESIICCSCACRHRDIFRKKKGYSDETGIFECCFSLSPGRNKMEAPGGTRTRNLPPEGSALSIRPQEQARTRNISLQSRRCLVEHVRGFFGNSVFYSARWDFFVSQQTKKNRTAQNCLSKTFRRTSVIRVDAAFASEDESLSTPCLLWNS